MRRINPLGFLGLVGFIGIAGFFSDSSNLFFYFAYLAYFIYFTQPDTPSLRRMAVSALALAYVLAFAVNLSFIVLTGLGRSLDYEAGFYLSYSVGSFAFPISFSLLKIIESFRKRRSATN